MKRKLLIMNVNEEITLMLCDTAGEEDYDLVRPLYYEEANVFLVCFSGSSPDSLKNMKTKYSLEISHYASLVPFILVGNKLDLRNNLHTIELLKESKCHLASVQEDEKMAKKIGAYCYMECLANLSIGVIEIFNEAVRISFTKREIKHSKKCVFL